MNKREQREQVNSIFHERCQSGRTVSPLFADTQCWQRGNLKYPETPVRQLVFSSSWRVRFEGVGSVVGSVRHRVIKGIGIRRQGAAFCFDHLLGMSIRTSFAWDGYCDVIRFDLVSWLHLPLMVMVTSFSLFDYWKYESCDVVVGLQIYAVQ